MVNGKLFAKDLRSIYTVPDEKTAFKRLEEAEKNGILIIRQPCADGMIIGMS